jgi:Putative lactococcus lactis phage r1t holin
MPAMFTTYFWKSALERALKSFAQALLAVVGVGTVGILDVAWAPALSTAAMAGVLSVLTSIASAKVGTPDDPSLVKPAEPVAETAAAQPRHVAATATA